MTGVSISVNATEALQRVVAAKRVLNPSVLLTTIGQAHLAWINRNFRAGGLEQRWPPLAPSTVYGRRQGSSAPLQDTGRLRASFVRGRAGNIFRVSGQTVIVGSANRVATIHHRGTGPYIIRPRGAFLAFPHPEGDATVRGRRGFVRRFVRHPGLPRRPLLPSQRTAGRIAVRELEAVVKKSLRGT